jgi:hypothetical protein
MNLSPENVQKLRELEQSENPPMGISHIRAILTYIDRNEPKNATAVYQLDGDKNYQYPRLQDHLQQMFGCRTHLVHNCPDWLCKSMQEDLKDRLEE